MSSARALGRTHASRSDSHGLALHRVRSRIDVDAVMHNELACVDRFGAEQRGGNVPQALASGTWHVRATWDRLGEFRPDLMPARQTGVDKLRRRMRGGRLRARFRRCVARLRPELLGRVADLVQASRERTSRRLGRSSRGGVAAYGGNVSVVSTPWAG